MLSGARTLLGAPSLTTGNKKLLRTKGIATRSKDAVRLEAIAIGNCKRAKEELFAQNSQRRLCLHGSEQKDQPRATFTHPDGRIMPTFLKSV